MGLSWNLKWNRLYARVEELVRVVCIRQIDSTSHCKQIVSMPGSVSFCRYGTLKLMLPFTGSSIAARESADCICTIRLKLSSIREEKTAPTMRTERLILRQAEKAVHTH